MFWSKIRFAGRIPVKNRWCLDDKSGSFDPLLKQRKLENTATLSWDAHRDSRPIHRKMRVLCNIFCVIGFVGDPLAPKTIEPVVAEALGLVSGLGV